MINLIGKIFGRLKVLERAENDKHGKARWLCLCGCGNQKIICSNNLIRGDTKSCGCLHKEIITKHGMKNTRMYRIYHDMLSRCNNPNHKYYKNWGGRKIIVCNRWNPIEGGSFENFLEDMKECSLGYSIDRTNNNLGYYKENCRWATSKEQNRNTRRNLVITFNNKTKLLIDWAKELNINCSTLYGRIYRYDWTIEKSLTTPSREYRYGN